MNCTLYIVYTYNLLTYLYNVNNDINFLDLNIQIINNKIKTNWYRKPIWSGLYINLFSNHSLSHKIGMIYSLTYRATLLSDKRFHINNLNYVRSTLLKNGYPLDLLNEKIYERYKKLFSNQQKQILFLKFIT